MYRTKLISGILNSFLTRELYNLLHLHASIFALHFVLCKTSLNLCFQNLFLF
jgi:hypothetical protein